MSDEAAVKDLLSSIDAQVKEVEYQVNQDSPKATTAPRKNVLSTIGENREENEQEHPSVSTFQKVADLGTTMKTDD